MLGCTAREHPLYRYRPLDRLINPRSHLPLNSQQKSIKTDLEVGSSNVRKSSTRAAANRSVRELSGAFTTAHAPRAACAVTCWLGWLRLSGCVFDSSTVQNVPKPRIVPSVTTPHTAIQYPPEGESSVSGGRLESARGMPGCGATSELLLSPRSTCTAESDRWMLRFGIWV